MSRDIKLPYFEYIDTTVGLRYLNNNRVLYLKILNNFLSRYKDLKVCELEDIELKNTIHSIKGLASTLGMVSLSNLATLLHTQLDRENLCEFIKALTLVIDELQTVLHRDNPKIILLITDKKEDLDFLLEHLSFEYDIAVAIDKESAFETISSEHISLILLDLDVVTIKDIEAIKREEVSILVIENRKESEDDSLVKVDYISKPFNINTLKNTIKHIIFDVNNECTI